MKAIAPVYGGINLEDIAAPRCFEIEARLRELLDIPVFHDDQHGTAIVVLAALTNALRVVGKEIADVRVVVCGVGAAGTAIITAAARAGRRRHRRLRPARARAPRQAGPRPECRQWLAENTNPRSAPGSLADALVGADVFIGVSAPNLLDRRRHRHDGRPTRSCSRWPTPTRRSTRARPASTPRWSRPAGRTTRTRSTTCWRSPACSAACSTRTPRDHRRDAAGRRRGDRRRGRGPELNASYIVPSVFDPHVASAVATAVREAAR